MADALQGRHALVTGGGTGIGLAIARALADHGAQVTITGRRAEPLEQAAAQHPGLHPAAMDVTDEDGLRAGIEAAVEARGPVQVCVANAGIAEGRSFTRNDLEFWNRIMETNVTGAFLTVRECLRSMDGTDWGRVIAVSSIAGLRGLKGGSAYTASKHAVIGMIRALSEERMGGPITFNALCPGYVDTPIVTRNTSSIAERAGISQEAALKVMTDANRHGRLLEPEEVAAAALWLCLPGSQSVNGQTIEIAGGQV
ncbi:3-hydroxyacyl-CoA dehydrogenase [Brevirhabdus pacifica]|uniref:3-hydroxyacyl-CoA dehydrogenase n=2 Tax=Brevirhabdus pacifica TaxID=1267768 RepID=A0A1U7DKY6_9RHOB|nr:SDR family oxidoreductase [Brevirhabdus pacifica]APX90585.1 3-hydroxyacyl-CoA dehydrogenase [Brevirhabdus pacifica]OWU78419.1 3-hydroxyacyl-CoA dehydrogenase [Loktanella sp. 22II-4b]PJJ85279.1 NAD(P)-dependent dehydrogenase (short-subunit alcohol dehydrogenase family) [Brevirhabdus pacifica]